MAHKKKPWICFNCCVLIEQKIRKRLIYMKLRCLHSITLSGKLLFSSILPSSHHIMAINKNWPHSFVRRKLIKINLAFYDADKCQFVCYIIANNEMGPFTSIHNILANEMPSFKLEKKMTCALFSSNVLPGKLFKIRDGIVSITAFG